MLCRPFRTPVIPYRTFDQLVTRMFSEARYYPDIPAPFGERVRLFFGLWEDGVKDRIYLFTAFDQSLHPSYDLYAVIYNAVNSNFIQRGASVLDVAEVDGTETTVGDVLLLRGFQQDASGKVWGYFATGEAKVFGFDNNGLPQIVRSQPTIFPARFNLNGLQVFLFDESQDIALISGPTTGRVPRELSVYRFSSGEFLYGVALPRDGVCITHVNRTTVMVLLLDSTVVTIDYAERRILQHTRLPIAGQSLTAGENLISWSKKYNRLLYVSKTPDTPGGESTAFVQGYRNVPIATHVCQPIPLRPARDGRDTPVLIKQIGDVGEGIAGSAVLGVEDYMSAAAVLRSPVALDGDGEGVGLIRGTAAGVADLLVSIDVECLVSAPDITNPLAV